MNKIQEDHFQEGPLVFKKVPKVSMTMTHFLA